MERLAAQILHRERAGLLAVHHDVVRVGRGWWSFFLVRQHIHCVFVGLNGLGSSRLTAMIAGFLVTLSVRSAAIKFGWSLPAFGESTKRERWKTEREDSTED